MPDKLTREQRHRCMASIRGKDTKPEMLVRRWLHSCGTQDLVYFYGYDNEAVI